MPLYGHAERLKQPAVRGRRHRWIVALLGAASVIAVLAVVIVSVSQPGSPPLAPGCVEGTIPSTLGAARLHACGSAARALCREAAAGRVPVPASVMDGCRRNGYIPAA